MSDGTTVVTLSGDQNTPVYQQIKEAIALKIHSGEWHADRKIPSENSLTQSLGASRMTVNRALRELSNEGLLRRVHGLGTFVAEPPRHAQLIELKSIADEIRDAGHQYSAHVLAQEPRTIRGELAELMLLPSGTLAHFAEVIHLQNEEPIQLEQRWINPKLIDGFLDADFQTITPTDFLISKTRPEDLEHIVQAILPTKAIASKLKIPSTEPCLKLRRRSWKAQQVITCVNLIYPSSRYDLGARFTPT